MNNNALYKISYGLFILTAKNQEKINGCVINTAIQVTSSPVRIAVTVNKDNFTHDLIKNSGIFNVSVLDVSAAFDLFKRFGFRSGKTADKFSGFEDFGYSSNGLPYLTKYACAFISGRVVDSVDLGTHTMFIADVSDGEILSDKEPMTYAYYHSSVKTQASSDSAPKKGWKCKICGYVYEHEEMADDFVCPICKHGASDFEKL